MYEPFLFEKEQISNLENLINPISIFFILILFLYFNIFLFYVASKISVF